MKRLPYDADLHMLIEPPKPINLNRLAFLRWLAEHGQLEHDIAGPAGGPLVEQSMPAPAPDYTGKAS